MIPAGHALLLGMAQVGLGLLGILLRREGLVVLASSLLALGGVLVLFCAGLAETGSTSQAEGVVVLVLLVALGLVGSAIVYACHRFRRAVVLDEHDELRG